MLVKRSWEHEENIPSQQLHIYVCQCSPRRPQSINVIERVEITLRNTRLGSNGWSILPATNLARAVLSLPVPSADLSENRAEPVITRQSPADL